jgi:hypothetical protein
MLVNDGYQRNSGKIELKILNSSGMVVLTSEVLFSVAALSQNTYNIKIRMPGNEGSYLLNTSAVQPDGSGTLCRRKIKIAAAN